MESFPEPEWASWELDKATKRPIDPSTGKPVKKKTFKKMQKKRMVDEKKWKKAQNAPSEAEREAKVQEKIKEGKKQVKSAQAGMKKTKKERKFLNGSSQKLTRLLRHTALDRGLRMRPDGFVKLDEIRRKCSEFSQLEFGDVRWIVDTNDKQRLSLQNEKDGWWIRANQGHSIGLDADELLTKLSDATQHPVVCHGTYEKYLHLILDSGLSKMARDHIHLTDRDVYQPSTGDKETHSGFRSSCNVLIYIDTQRAMDDGVAFYISSNGVILTAGIDGYLPPKYFTRVIHRHSGKIFFESGNRQKVTNQGDNMLSFDSGTATARDVDEMMSLLKALPTLE